MPFDVAWDQLLTRLRQQPIDAITLSVEDGDGGLAEYSWRHVDAGFAASAIEIMHGFPQAALLPAANRVVAADWHRAVVAIGQVR